MTWQPEVDAVSYFVVVFSILLTLGLVLCIVVVVLKLTTDAIRSPALLLLV